MGVVCWKSGDRMWIAKSKDAKADYNSTAEVSPSEVLELASQANEFVEQVKSLI